MIFRERMTPMAIVVAVDHDGGFGADGKIPWHYPEDLKYFQKTTSGGICVMGRKTYEDMFKMYVNREGKKKTVNKAVKKYLTMLSDGKEPPSETLASSIKEILPGRKSFVVTSNVHFKAPGAIVVPSLRAAVNMLDVKDNRTIFILGGYRMYIEGLTWADKVHMTIVEGRYNCDRFFPVNVLRKKFRVISGEQVDKLQFVTYQRAR